jgi:hypothetical protein
LTKAVRRSSSDAVSPAKSRKDICACGNAMDRYRRQLEKLEGQMDWLRRKTRELERVGTIKGTKLGAKKALTKPRTAARRKVRGL